MPSLIALPSENTTEAQLSQNFSQMYILMGKALYSRNECCNNQLKTILFPDNSFFQVHSHFSRIFNKIIKFQYFSRTGKTVVIFPGFPGAVGTLNITLGTLLTNIRIQVIRYYLSRFLVNNNVVDITLWSG